MHSLANRRAACLITLLVGLACQLAVAQTNEIPPYPTTAAPVPMLLQAPAEAIATPTVSPPVLAAPASEASPTASPVDTPASDYVDASVDSVMAEPAQVVHWYHPTYWFGPAPWDTSFELGINGSSGTSESLSIRTGGAIKRKTDTTKLDTSLYYNKTSANGDETQSNALFDGRHDWLLGNSPWTVFAMTQVFYDEFQAFDLNVNVNSGLGYQVLDEDWVKLLTRFGAGASREFGGPRDEWVPEAQFGIDYEQQISKTQKFYAKMDYFPEWENFNNYRILTDMGLEIELNRPSNVSLKLSLTDRFDSSPNGVPPHNTNYSVLLLWKL